MTIASVWPEPWRVMWAIASSIESTTATARILSRYSVSQSAACARLHGRDEAPRPRRHRGARRPHARGPRGFRQEIGGDRLVDQERLGGVADAGALDFGVHDDLDRHIEVAARVDVDMAVSLVVFQNGHRRLGDDAADQAFAAARNRQVDQIGEGEQLADGRAVDGRDELNGGLGQAADDSADRPARGAGPGWCPSASFPPRRMTAFPLLTQSAAASTVTLGRLS